MLFIQIRCRGYTILFQQQFFYINKQVFIDKYTATISLKYLVYCVPVGDFIPSKPLSWTWYFSQNNGVSRCIEGVSVKSFHPSVISEYK